MLLSVNSYSIEEIFIHFHDVVSRLKLHAHAKTDPLFRKLS
jgi:hypothetical protein